MGQYEAHKGDTAVLAGLIGLGLFQVFLGVRFFRVSLAVAAFTAAFIFSTAIATHHVDNDEYVYGIGAAAGVAAALVAGCFVKLGMLLLGVGAGLASSYIAYLAVLHYTSVNDGDAVFYATISVAGVLGALIGSCLSRWIVIFATAIGGSVVVTRSIDVLWDNVLTKDAVESGNLPRQGWELIAGCGVLALAGIVFQAVGGHGLDGKKKTRVQERNADEILRLPIMDDEGPAQRV